MGFFDKLFGGKAEQEETAKFFGQSKTCLLYTSPSPRD